MSLVDFIVRKKTVPISLDKARNPLLNGHLLSTMPKNYPILSTLILSHEEKRFGH